MRKANISNQSSRRKGKKKYGEEAIVKEIMTSLSLELIQDLNPQVLEAQNISSKI